MGGMIKVVVLGMFKLWIEEMVVWWQVQIDWGEDVIVGVNKYWLVKEDLIDILDIDNVKVCDVQIVWLECICVICDQVVCDVVLLELGCCMVEGGNLLEVVVECVCVCVSVGEISLVMEGIFGCYRVEVKILVGVYGVVYEGDVEFVVIQCDIEVFVEEEGCCLWMLVVKMGQDGYDCGVKVIVIVFVDIGFDVDVGLLFQIFEEVVQDVVDNDVYVVGIFLQVVGYKMLVLKLIVVLKVQGVEEILVICGGVILQQDYEFLCVVGVKVIFGLGINIFLVVCDILNLICVVCDV